MQILLLAEGKSSGERGARKTLLAKSYFNIITLDRYDQLISDEQLVNRWIVIGGIYYLGRCTYYVHMFCMH